MSKQGSGGSKDKESIISRGVNFIAEKLGINDDAAASKTALENAAKKFEKSVESMIDAQNTLVDLKALRQSKRPPSPTSVADSSEVGTVANSRSNLNQLLHGGTKDPLSAELDAIKIETTEQVYKDVANSLAELDAARKITREAIMNGSPSSKNNSEPVKGTSAKSKGSRWSLF